MCLKSVEFNALKAIYCSSIDLAVCYEDNQATKLRRRYPKDTDRFIALVNIRILELP